MDLDVVKFMNDVTGDNLLFWKVVLATVVFGLAGLQVALASRFFGVTALPVSGPAAARLHRYSGRLVILLGLLVGFSCVVGPAGPSISPAPQPMASSAIASREPRAQARGRQPAACAAGFIRAAP